MSFLGQQLDECRRAYKESRDMYAELRRALGVPYDHTHNEALAMAGHGGGGAAEQSGAFGLEPRKVVRSSDGLGDAVAGVVAERDELMATIQEMLATLRVNLLRGTLRTDDDAFFERLLNKWSGWSSASPNDLNSPTPPHQGGTPEASL